MHDISFLADAVVLFGAALLVLLLSRKAGLPPVVGFLLTGALAGPEGLALIGEVEEVEVLAELGVVFLLFVVALELSLPRLKQVGRYLLVGGSIQFGLTVAAGWLGALALGLPSGPAAVAALGLGMSSTAIALKVLGDRNELQAPHGRVALGILLFQDLVFVPALLLVPLLVGAESASTGNAWVRALGGLGVVAGTFVIGRTAMPVVLRWIVESGIRELFILLALFVCLGGAVLTYRLGFSPALGAFLAGLLIADSEYHYHVLTETGPLRDVFTSLFFISVGMLLDVPFALANVGLVVALALGAMIGKGVVVWIAATLMGLRGRTRLMSGVALAQVGEFAFVLFGAGFLSADRDGPFALLVPAGVLTMLLSPLLIRFVADRSVDTTASVAAASDPAEPVRVLIGGAGLNGRNLSKVLESAGMPASIVDIDTRRARQAAGPDDRIVLGDITRPDVLVRAGVRTVDVAVFALSDPTATLTAVRIARGLNPAATIIARASKVSEIAGLTAAGADEVVAEEFETSIEIVTRLLRRLHVPGNVIRAEARLLRADDYQMLRRVEGEVGLTDRLARALAGGTTDTVALAPGSPAVGNSLAGLRLRERSGASVVSVVRGGRAHANPPPDWTLQVDDVLFLLGSHEQIERALACLEPDAP